MSTPDTTKETEGNPREQKQDQSSEFMAKRLSDKEKEIDEMDKEAEEAKKKEKAAKPMLNKTNKMILCAVIFGLLVIACMATPAGLGLAAIAIVTAGVGAYGLATAVKGVMKKTDPIKEAKEKVRDARIEAITKGLPGQDKTESQGDKIDEVVKKLLEKTEIGKDQDKILKYAKEALGEGFKIKGQDEAEKSLFEGDDFDKFFKNLSEGLKADSRSNTEGAEGVKELRYFVEAIEKSKDNRSEKRLRLDGLKDFFKECNKEGNKAEAKNMLNAGEGTAGDKLKSVIGTAETKVVDGLEKQKQAQQAKQTQTAAGGGVTV
jgi:hypothetical protein